MITTLDSYQKTLRKAAKLCKGPSGLARACGVTPQAVDKWLKGKIPIARCPAVESATHGKVTRYELRPDFFGAKPDWTLEAKGSSTSSVSV